MLAKGMDETTIMEMTGLSQEQIYELNTKLHSTQCNLRIYVRM